MNGVTRLGRIRNIGTTKVGGISKKLVNMLWICRDYRKIICEQNSDVGYVSGRKRIPKLRCTDSIKH